MVSKNEIHEVTIVDVGSLGEGICKIDNFVIIVPRAVPGDRVNIRILKVRKTMGYGRIESFIEKSPNRVEPVCPEYNKCGGCNMQHMKYEYQLEFKTDKVKQAINRIGKIDFDDVKDTIGMEDPYNYRNKAQLPAGLVGGKPALGFYRLKSHDLVPVKKCYIQNDSINEVIAMMNQFIEENDISTYDEKTKKGSLRHVLIKSGTDGLAVDEIMVGIIVKNKKFAESKKLVEFLKTNEKIKSIILNHNMKDSNTIVGRKNTLLYGRDFINDTIGDYKFERTSLSFFQVNPAQTNVLYKVIKDFAGLTGSETVVDAYCGIGTIALFLSDAAKKVYGIEIIEEAVIDARKNAELNNVTNAEFIVGKSEEKIFDILKTSEEKIDLIVLDPPRRGCDIKMVNAIIDAEIEKVIYVSCDPATLGRDLNVFSEAGYVVEMVQPVDMFPHTTHVETVVMMTRVDK